MSSVSSMVGSPALRWPSESRPYPFQAFFAKWALLCGIVVGGLSTSVLAGFTCFAFLFCVGVVWRRNEPTISLCLALQWAEISWGYLYLCVYGIYPGFRNPGGVEKAVLFSTCGLLALALGIRVGLLAFKMRPQRARALELRNRSDRYSIPALFFSFIALGAIDWFVMITPMHLWFGGAQLICKVLSFRGIFLVLLVLSVLRQRRGYDYLFVALGVALISSMASMMSAVVGLVLLPLTAILHWWRPWSVSPLERQRSKRVFALAVALCVLLVFLATVWEGAIKGKWRHLYMTGQVEGNTFQRASQFVSVAQSTLGDYRPSHATARVVARLSAAPGYFGRVVERVPALIPHEDGYFSLRAMKHVVMPRILFPKKEILHDSWMVRKYAGIHVAGHKRGTSIGFGYMTQTYIDFGFPGMLAPIFLLGCVMGWLYVIIYFSSPSYLFFQAAALCIFLGDRISYATELAKAAGSTITHVLVFAIILYCFGDKLHSSLLAGQTRSRGYVPR